MQLRVYVGYGVGAGALAVKRRRLQDRNPRPVSGPGIAVRALAELVWRHGVGGVLRNLREGYAMGTLAELATLAGAAQGVIKARRMELLDGRFSKAR